MGCVPGCEPGSDDFGTVEDGNGGVWPLCGPYCGVAVVRPGKVQCECDDDPDYDAFDPESLGKFCCNDCEYGSAD